MPVVGAANEISDMTTCKDLKLEGTEPLPGDNCFAGSTLRRAAVAGGMVLAAGAAVLAMIAGGVVAIRGGRGVIFVLLALIAVTMFFGAYGAARI